MLDGKAMKIGSGRRQIGYISPYLVEDGQGVCYVKETPGRDLMSSNKVYHVLEVKPFPLLLWYKAKHRRLLRPNPRLVFSCAIDASSFANPACFSFLLPLQTQRRPSYCPSNDDMALTPVLLETYRRYKKETNTVVDWLATTASKAGNVAHLLSSTAPQKPGGRLKGKARTAQLPLPSTIKVPVNCFEQLAKNIASADFLVPERILDILKNIIYAWQVCARFYEIEGSEDVEVIAKNTRHKYFIRVLENVQMTLKSKSGPKTAGVPRPKTHEQEHHVEEQLSNIFEHLEIEDCLYSESPEDHESASSPSQPIYELETSEDTFLDEAFAYIASSRT
jgi:hypothetical protein